MYLKVKLDDGAIKPHKAHSLDAGFDLFSRESIEIPARGSQVFDTGVHFDIPSGIVGFLKSRSGLNCKHGIQSEGVIDAGYTGSIIIKLYNNSDKSYKVNQGDKISQIVFIPIPEITLCEVSNISELNSSDRGADGIGSTGK